MILKLKSYKFPLLVLLLLVIFLIPWRIPMSQGLASSEIKLVIDGRDIVVTPLPVIRNNRTLVPIRFISEELGAEVKWDGEARTVHIKKDNRSVQLRIDSHLVKYEAGRETFDLSDVAPIIIEDRTFVPVRLVSNALGVAVNWDGETKTVYVDSEQTSDIEPFFDITVSTVTEGQTITGLTELESSFLGVVPQGAAEIRYLLLDPDTGKGSVVARGSEMEKKYYWLPDLKESGQRVLVSAVYNSEGALISGDAVSVNVEVTPKAILSGLTEGQLINDTVSLQADLNFAAPYVKYEITNKNTGKVFVTDEFDPQGGYNWTPMMEDNGNVSIRAIAYDHSGQAYTGQAISVKVDVPRKLQLRGISANSTIEKPVTLSVFRNFQVSQTEYVMKDVQTGNEEVLAQVGYTSYRWFPGIEQSGDKELYVRVKDTSGITHVSKSIGVTLTGKPQLILEGVGPNQVVTDSVKLKSSSNTHLNSVKYILIDSKGNKKVIASGTDPRTEYTWETVKGDEGNCRILAEGTLSNGTKVFSEEVSVKVYLGKIYSSKPVIEKEKFLDLASGLAGESNEKYGMSAALQTAQAILETGWGQSVPVDKYSGNFSYNLFGIKGSGPSGSVISNTWEEYNGQVFRVDAEFRAYDNVNESWADHKKLLLTASRYEPFRNVMHDSTQGAWALRRCGYATDSRYPLKLINIINTYGLEKLDEVTI